MIFQLPLWVEVAKRLAIDTGALSHGICVGAVAAGSTVDVAEETAALPICLRCPTMRISVASVDTPPFPNTALTPPESIVRANL
jgi:hypothetical protein